MKIFITLFLFSIGISATGQLNSFSDVDDKTASIGAMPAANLATITETITGPFSSKEQKARAIFYWITHHITINPRATKSNNQKNTKPEEIIQLRNTTPLGYSLLFQEMCSQANIRCLSVDGYTKNSSEDIGNRPDELNHSWNVVQLGQSPDSWHYVDAAKGSGYLDKRMSTFTPMFGSNYFFTEPEVFNLDHFPDNEAWRLGSGPRSISEFYAMPVVYPYANSIGLQKTDPKQGKIKTKPSRAIKFSFFHLLQIPVHTLEMVTGEDKRAGMPVAINFTDEGGAINFTYQFKREDEYPVTFFVNGKPVISYIIISEE